MATINLDAQFPPGKKFGEENQCLKIAKEFSNRLFKANILPFLRAILPILHTLQSLWQSYLIPLRTA